MPGNESAVTLTDSLTESFQLFSNGIKLSAARRDKGLMQEVLKETRLDHVAYFASDKLEKIVFWAKKLKKWPIVLKPVRSASTDHVIFCNYISEIKKAFQSIYGKKNILGIKNEQVIAQECLLGTEYIVNTISYNKQHFLSDLWEYKKTYVAGAGRVYDYAKLLPYTFREREKLTNYIFKVLDALEIKYGPAHSEVFLTERGPVLVETGARVMGAIKLTDITTAIGRNQLELTIQSYTKPDEFLKRIGEPYNINKHILVKILISSKSGKITAINQLQQINDLPSFHSMDLEVKTDSQLYKTIDLHSSPGKIVLMHEDEDVVMQDYLKLHEIEQQMFEVEEQ